MAVTRAARAPHRAHGHMYMRTPIDRQKHAACCAALHPRLSSTCAGRIISAATVDSHRTTCESVRMCESNRSVCPVEMAVGVWVVIETSGQGGFRVENIAPGARRGPAGEHSACANLHSSSLQGTTAPFGTIKVEAAHQKITSQVRKASTDCSSSTEASHHRCCWSAARAACDVKAPLEGVPVWTPFFDDIL